MLWLTLGIAIWFPLVSGLAGAFGRLAKAAWPTMPKLLLPASVLTSAYLMILVDLSLDDSAPFASDATVALWGVLLGGGAVGGHELVKKIIEGVLGTFLNAEQSTALAEALLGKLKERATPPPAKPKATGALLVFVGALSVLGMGCTAHQIASALDAVSHGTAALSAAISAGETGAEVYFARHPNPEAHAAVKRAVHEARRAEEALAAALATADAANDGDLMAAKDHALSKYGVVVDLLTDLGILDARGPDGGAEAEGAPYPEPFELPPPERINVLMGGGSSL